MASPATLSASAKLHRVEGRAVRGAEVEGAHDMRVSQAREGVELALEQHGMSRLAARKQSLERQVRA
jgi:hypothetical protein